MFVERTQKMQYDPINGPSRDEVQLHIEKLIKVWIDKGIFNQIEGQKLMQTILDARLNGEQVALGKLNNINP